MIERRTVVLGLASLPIGLSALGLAGRSVGQEALGGDTIETSGGDLVIHPVSHATLALGYGDQIIYVDPGETDMSALPPPTAILITHAHGDHFNAAALSAMAGNAPILTTEEVAGQIPEALRGQTATLKNGESGELAGIAVMAVAAYNTTPDRQQYHPKGLGNGYVLTFGDKNVYVAGDTEDTPEMRALTDIAVAFLPMNLPYTMTEEQAADAVKAFRPGIVYPYHYRGSDTAKFKTLVGDAAEVRLVDWYAQG